MIHFNKTSTVRVLGKTQIVKWDKFPTKHIKTFLEK